MKKTFIKLSAVAAFALTFGVSTVASAAEPAVKVVTKDNMQGWALNADPDNIVDYAFVDGNASIGTGSLQVGPITNTNNGGTSSSRYTPLVCLLLTWIAFLLTTS
jgi:hypothetical protein